ncbi:11S globulin seed storage protein 2-like [Salvia splendens]|uniref:11S globulin seed storage protein 2-like n=1 Tax=Salvia splendens TaxID=180675 RepID=UPI001C270F66|nr:11S globulin seed storage protein 2-like [Salvia splendens]
MARESMRYIRPDEDIKESSKPYHHNNGFEETFCTTKIRTNIENQRDADIYSRENSMLSPHWAMDGHTIVYVTRGEAKVEVVDHSGQTMMNDRVSQGDMLVVPQFYTSTARAGNEGFEWVAFKTSGYPMRNDMAGYTSALRATSHQRLPNVARRGSIHQDQPWRTNLLALSRQPLILLLHLFSRPTRNTLVFQGSM